MTKGILTTIVVLGLISCNQTNKNENQTKDLLTSEKTKKEEDPLIGSWVQPNPINENEVQGLKINNGGTAESINMNTLVYKKWWKENDKLVLVFESIGNDVSSVDTTKYEIIKLSQDELELKERNFTTKYTKQ